MTLHTITLKIQVSLSHADLGCDQESEDEQDSDAEMMIPNVRTFVRSDAPHELARSSSNKRSRGVAVDLHLVSVTHCGGGLIKGSLILRWQPNAKKNRTTQVAKIQLDCLGTECITDPLRFLN